MTKRESAKIVARRRTVECIMRGLQHAEALEFTKRLDIAETVLGHLEARDRIERGMAMFRRHRKADPHCTCNDCLAYHAETVR